MVDAVHNYILETEKHGATIICEFCASTGKWNSNISAWFLGVPCAACAPNRTVGMVCGIAVGGMDKRPFVFDTAIEAQNHAIREILIFCDRYETDKNDKYKALLQSCVTDIDMTQTEYCQKVKDLVLQHKDVLNIAGLEKKAGFANNSLRKALLGSRILMANEARSIARALHEIGFEFSGLNITDRELRNLRRY